MDWRMKTIKIRINHPPFYVMAVFTDEFIMKLERCSRDRNQTEKREENGKQQHGRNYSDRRNATHAHT